MLMGLTQHPAKLLFIGRINGATFGGNVGKLLVSFRRGAARCLRALGEFVIAAPYFKGIGSIIHGKQLTRHPGFVVLLHNLEKQRSVFGLGDY